MPALETPDVPIQEVHRSSPALLIDLHSPSTPDIIECEICVIGGGAVGLTLGAELARRGRNVVLLEAGGFGLEQETQRLYQGVSVGHPFNNIEVGRYRVLGGTTTFWAGQVVELTPIVWEQRPWIAPFQWPVDHHTMRALYLRAYRLLGLDSAELEDADVWRMVGAKSPRLSEELDIKLTRWLPVRNFARLFRDDIDASRNLTLVLHANVTDFSIDGDQNCISKVFARTLSGKRLTVRPRVTILACGTIEIARLLLHAMQVRKTPWEHSSWVGRGFYDHLHINAGDVHILNRKAFGDIFDSIYAGGFKYYPVIRLSEKMQREQQLVDIGAQFTFSGSYITHINNIRMFASSILKGHVPSNLAELPGHFLSVAKIATPLLLRYLAMHRSFKPSDSKAFLTLFSEQIPIARSSVRLGSDADALGIPKIEVDWQIDGGELKSLVVFGRAIRRVLAEKQLARVTLAPELDDEDPAFLENAKDGVHHMGTARIGTSMKDGVVDQNLRVFGTSNLYVAGAAVFPTSGFANPTFTAIALALRLCDHLNAEL